MVATHLRYFALVGVLGGLGLSACKDGGESARAQESTGGEASTVEAGEPVLAVAPDPTGGEPVSEPVSEPVKVVAPVAPPKAASPADRAKALGYARYLPKDTQAYCGTYDGKGFVKSILDSSFGAFALNLAKEEGGMDLAELTQDPQVGMVLSLLAEEFFVAVGAGAGEQANNLILLSESSNFHQMKGLVKMLDAELTGKEPDGPSMGMEAMMMPLIGGLLQDPRAGLGVLENAQMPPLTIGFKVGDAEAREQVSGMLTGGLMEFLTMVGPDGEDVAEALKVERGEDTFTGVKILWKKLAAKMDKEGRDDMAELMDEASIERLITIVGGKNLVVATGVHDGYIILFAGSDEAELQIAASPAESMAANPQMAFVDGFLDKKLLSVCALSQEMLDGLTKNSTALGGLAGGIKAGLGESKGFGDTRDLEVLLDLLMKQEKELLALTKYYDGGMVAYREEGLKIEGFGGSNGAGVKLETPHRYGSLAKRDDVLLFSNWVDDEEYMAQALAYLDTIGETLYLGAKRISKLDIDDGDLEEFREGFGLFDAKLRPDLLELWKAIRSDLGKGLGGEGALVVDLQGGMPTVPELPQAIVDQGKAPRFGLVKPVTDRDSISASWKRINTSMAGLLKTACELS